MAIALKPSSVNYSRYNTFENNFNLLQQANMQSALQQQQFQKYMSDTAHSREVADLQRAGLNPALSLNNGASSPAGAYANIDSSPISGRYQSEITKRQIAAQEKMNDKTLQNQYAIAELNNKYSQAIQKYNTDMQYALGLQQSQMSYDATMYGYQNAFAIQRFLQSNENSRYYYQWSNPRSVEEAKAYLLRNSGALDSATNLAGSAVNTVLDAMNTTGLGLGFSNKSLWQNIKDGVNSVGNWLAEKAHNYRVNQDKKDDIQKTKNDLNQIKKNLSALDGRMKLSGIHNDKYRKSLGYGSKYYNKGSSVK